MPTVTCKTLRYQEQGREQIMSVGTTDWYTWLQAARAFTFRTSSGQVTVRKEQAGNKRGSWYWKAYYRREGKLCSAYLGKSERLSLELLQEVAAMAGSGSAHNSPHEPAGGEGRLLLRGPPGGN